MVGSPSPAKDQNSLTQRRGQSRTKRPLSSHLAERTRRPIVGVSGWAKQVKRQVRRFAPHSLPVLITGPTGTGKELIARAIHTESLRCDKPFIAINCAAVVGQLFESHMFGHVQGAFSGAHSDRVGCFRTADRGTVFLDEIGELDLELQAKLLRVLQEGIVVPVGSDEELTVDVRIVAATNRSLADELDRGGFREDLYYRLAVVTLHAIPLAERPEDIEVLADHLLAQQSIEYGLPHKRLSSAALRRLRAYSWPGNVRQLRTVLELAAIEAETETIQAEDLALGGDVLSRDSEHQGVAGPESPDLATSQSEALRHPGLVNGKWMTMDELQRWHLERTMAHAHHNQSEAARLLNMDRSVLRRRLKRYGLS